MRPDETALRAYADAMGSRHEATRRLQAVFEGGYMRCLRQALIRRAQEYAKMFPERVEIIRVNRRMMKQLRGFDPAAAAATFLPFERPGRPGSPWIRESLRRMGETTC